MFGRARLRLTLLYIGLFALVLGAFTIVFYVGFATVLAPDFDIGPELTNEQAADAAYQATIERIGVALVVADVIVIGLVGAAAWVLAARTLRPIRDAHLRQRRFVADASHEMRTPLAVIRAAAEEATRPDLSADEMRTALTRIVTATEGLARTTNDLLLLARTDERLIDPRPEQFDLSVLAAETVEAFVVATPDAVTPKLTLVPDLVVSADRDEIRRVILNLVDNAVRYGRVGVTVRVATGRSDRDATVEVHDDGPGISAANLDHVFEPFFRGHADAASPQGSGLGLAIARSLAERNGGRLTVASAPGAGATFRLALPRFR